MEFDQDPRYFIVLLPRPQQQEESIRIRRNLIGKYISRYCLEPIRREIRYLIYYKRNVEQLKAGVERLCCTRADVHGVVAGRKDKTVSVDVLKWLEDVGVAEKSSNILLSEAKSNKKLLNGCCPNPTTIYSLSKKTIKMFEHIVELQEEMIIDKIEDPAPPPRIGSITLSALNPEFSRRRQHNPRNLSESQTKNKKLIGQSNRGIWLAVVSCQCLESTLEIVV